MDVTKAKATVGAVGLFLTVLTTVFADSVFNVGEVGEVVGGLVVAGMSVYGIWRVPNKPVS